MLRWLVGLTYRRLAERRLGRNATRPYNRTQVSRNVTP
jgi:hypothetical protein